MTLSPSPAVRPRLEALEDRQVPASLADQALVSAVYQGFLDRIPDASAVPYWTGQIDSGATRLEVVSGILGSAEYRAREVAGLYPALLGRPADRGGLNAWIGSLAGGASIDQVRAGVLASDEFYGLTGATPQGFLDGLYLATLGRNPDALAQSVFLPSVAQGASGRLSTALGVLGSDESLRLRVDNAYDQILGRSVDPVGRAVWSNVLRAGTSDEGVLAGLVASDDFLGRLGVAVTAGAGLDSDVARYLANNHLFILADGPVPVTGPSFEAASLVLQSGAFGPVDLPAGLDLSSTVARPGLFGVNGFTPRNVLATNQVGPTQTSTVTAVNQNLTGLLVGTGAFGNTAGTGVFGPTVAGPSFNGGLSSGPFTTAGAGTFNGGLPAAPTFNPPTFPTDPGTTVTGLGAGTNPFGPTLTTSDFGTNPLRMTSGAMSSPF